MADLARLKAQARGCEAKEEWSKAIDCYVQAIRLLETAGVESDLGLYNRVGDLYLKIGNTGQAVTYWERGIDGYMEAGFYNNAMALCNKILRTVPNRDSVYLKLGQISARKGFLSDARKNFLEYADRMRRAGKLDEAFRALQEFAELQPEPEIRLLLADQLLAHERVPQAVDQLRYAWRDLMSEGRQADADEVRARILELAPGRDPLVDRPEETQRAVAPRELDVEGIIELPELEPSRTGEFLVPPSEETVEEVQPEAAEEEVSAEPPTPEEELEAVIIEPTEVEPVAPPVGFQTAEEIALEYVEPPETEAEAPTEAPQGEGAPEEGLLDVSEAFDLRTEQAASEWAPSETEAGEFDLSAATAEEDTAPPDLGAEASGAAETILEGVGELPIFYPEDALTPGAEAPPAPAPEAATRPAPAPTVEEVRERLREDPEDHDLRTRLAELLLEEGRRPEALRELRRALEGYESQGRLLEADRVASDLLRLNPNDVRAHQKRVELAVLRQEPAEHIRAYLDLGDCLDRLGASDKARAVYECVLELDPGNERALGALRALGVETTAAEAAPAEKPRAAAAAPEEERPEGEEYVDLGALLRSEEAPPSSRFELGVAEPAAEEEFDFGDMLAQFKAKVAEGLTQEDYASHYDLGIAYKEMGLLDEAIAEFQIAARADSHRLRAQEMLGRCFVEKGEYRIAQKVLLRALKAGGEEEALVGVLYDLGHVHEALAEPARALEFYERVFSIDVNFRDVGARIEALRGSLPEGEGGSGRSSGRRRRD